jgi:hypothetical protein
VTCGSTHWLFAGELRRRGYHPVLHLLSSDTGWCRAGPPLPGNLIQLDQPWGPLAHAVSSGLGPPEVAGQWQLVGRAGYPGRDHRRSRTRDRAPTPRARAGPLDTFRLFGPEKNAEFLRREPVAPPGTALLDELIARTGRAMDSVLDGRFLDGAGRCRQGQVISGTIQPRNVVVAAAEANAPCR